MTIPTTFVLKETQPRPGGALFESEPRRVGGGQDSGLTTGESGAFSSLAHEIMGMDRWRRFQNRI